MQEEVKYNGSVYQKDAKLNQPASLTPEEEKKLRDIIDFLDEQGYHYEDTVCFLGSVTHVSCFVIDRDGKRSTIASLRHMWLPIAWRGSILYRLAEIEGQYSDPDHRWKPGKPGYPGPMDLYYAEWKRLECRRLDKAYIAEGVTANDLAG